MFVHWYKWPLCFGWLLAIRLYKEDYLHILDLFPLDNTAFAVSADAGISLTSLTTTIGLLSLLRLNVLSRSAIDEIEHFVEFLCCRFVLLFSFIVRNLL